MTKRELILFSILVFISFTVLALIFVISVKAENEEQPSENKPSAYILLCDNFSDGIMNSTVCSSNSIFKLVPLENKK